MTNVVVRARVRELQAASATATTLTMQERREMLAGLARGEKGKVAHRDLVAILHLDASLAGELVVKAEQRDTTTPREPLEAVKARFAAAQARLRVVPREGSG